MAEINTQREIWVLVTGKGENWYLDCNWFVHYIDHQNQLDTFFKISDLRTLSKNFQTETGKCILWNLSSDPR